MEQHPPRLMDKVRETWRLKHYSSKTEGTYVHWILRFIRFHKLRHPRESNSSTGPRPFRASGSRRGLHGIPQFAVLVANRRI